MPQHATKLADLVGRSGFLDVDPNGKGKYKLQVAIRILDAKQAYGRVDVLIEPKWGSGHAWVTYKGRNAHGDIAASVHLDDD